MVEDRQNDVIARDVLIDLDPRGPSSILDELAIVVELRITTIGTRHDVHGLLSVVVPHGFNFEPRYAVELLEVLEKRGLDAISSDIVLKQVTFQIFEER